MIQANIPMTLLGAAHGRTGREILRALVARGQPVRALVRKEAQSAALLSLGGLAVSRETRDTEL